MPWSAPPYTGGVVWEDTPSVRTPLNAADLNLEENAEAFYAATVGQSVVTYFEGGGSLLGITNLGNVAAAVTLDLGGLIARAFTFVLTAPSCAISVAHAEVGSVVDVYPYQDGSPPRVVTHPAAVTWTSAGVPVLSTVANNPDRFSYRVLAVDGAGTPTKMVGSLGSIGSAPTGTTSPPGMPTIVGPLVLTTGASGLPVPTSPPIVT